jgi:hypothetical protein
MEKSDPDFLDVYHTYVIDFSPTHRGYWILNSVGEVVAKTESYDMALAWVDNQVKREKEL